MIWILVMLLVGLAVGVGVFLYTRQRSSQPQPGIAKAQAAAGSASVRTTPTDKRFWGKQFIVLDQDHACPEALAMHGHCFATGKAPPLPLEGCAVTGCACHFRDIEDRRSGKERRAGHERREQIRFEDFKDRRVGKDRRGDHYDWRFTA